MVFRYDSFLIISGCFQTPKGVKHLYRIDDIFQHEKARTGGLRGLKAKAKALPISIKNWTIKNAGIKKSGQGKKGVNRYDYFTS